MENPPKRKRKGPGIGPFKIEKQEAAKYGFTAPKNQDAKEQYITPNQAGRILGITGEAIKQWIYHRRLPAVKLSNGYWKVRIKDLEDFIQARQDVGRRRIMLVTQANTAAKDVVSAIENLNQEPIVAHNFADALLKAADLVPALFILNLDLTQEGAWNFIERVKQHRSLRRLPILLISAEKLTDKDCELAVNAGIQGMLQRPVTLEMIQGEITNILRRIM